MRVWHRGLAVPFLLTFQFRLTSRPSVDTHRALPARIELGIARRAPVATAARARATSPRLARKGPSVHVSREARTGYSNRATARKSSALCPMGAAWGGRKAAG